MDIIFICGMPLWLFFFFIWTDRLIVVNLLKYTAYQVQIRHRSNQAHNPLWSDWSPLVIVPAGKVILFLGSVEVKTVSDIEYVFLF